MPIKALFKHYFFAKYYFAHAYIFIFIILYLKKKLSEQDFIKLIITDFRKQETNSSF